MDVMQRLVDKGNSIICIEHNLDVIRCSDWLIDLGPEGGTRGQIVACGTPEEVAQHPASHTGRYLAKVFEQHPLKSSSSRCLIADSFLVARPQPAPLFS